MPLISHEHKGNTHELLGIAKNIENLEETAVYRACYSERGLWVRPLSMWNEEVVHEGKRVKRFTFIGKTEDGNEGD
ncbi:MAG: DUF1653 domain-containing protein [Clostridiales bacterium]|nr:DUF1653 domain-containing protein [Clostridiales bacterium]